MIYDNSHSIFLDLSYVPQIKLQSIHFITELKNNVIPIQKYKNHKSKCGSFCFLLKY